MKLSAPIANVCMLCYFENGKSVFYDSFTAVVIVRYSPRFPLLTLTFGRGVTAENRCHLGGFILELSGSLEIS